MDKLIQFEDSFGKYACIGDFIEVGPDDKGYTYRASIEEDTQSGPPDEQVDGFWPSLDPKAAGWIGPNKTQADLEADHARQQAVMDAWNDVQWRYVGIVLSIRTEDGWVKERVESIWGVEMNYPGTDNEYLTEVANELLGEVT